MPPPPPPASGHHNLPCHNTFPATLFVLCRTPTFLARPPTARLKKNPIPQLLVLTRCGTHRRTMHPFFATRVEWESEAAGWGREEGG